MNYGLVSLCEDDYFWVRALPLCVAMCCSVFQCVKCVPVSDVIVQVSNRPTARHQIHVLISWCVASVLRGKLSRYPMWSGIFCKRSTFL